ncbi:MAG TPA: bifunctional phosphoribosylaminoimidazolecarboxamide formyltransferase/IMP cyclohydrolase [Vicinamibacterales bacterium]|nr:bifunctional phosphoribosylaminoimidazolecarboxamide formyltransferase/IMP cyclohydrolase [Vicinamibacterales bacterium]
MRALLSVSDKTGLVPFARALTDLGWELVSTGGTARALASAGLPVRAISDVTGFPEMLDGRVKTLHPKVHGGILARRDRPDDLSALAAHGIVPIDLVAVNLYPFAQAAARADLALDDLIEEIDIGGPSLVRAAAKNFRDVLVVVEPGDYDEVLAALSAPSGADAAFRFELARRAFAHTAAYDRMIAGTLGEVRADKERGTVSREAPAAGTSLPPTWQPSLVKIRDLRYGENPHQPGAWYADDGSGGDGRAGFGAATVHQGKELSFTNLLDLDAAARLALEFDEPAAVVIKHTNPCGVATGASAAEAYVRAREADALSAFGGIVGVNRPLDVETARALTSTFIEAVIAPGLADADEVRAVLGTKANLRVVTASFAQLADRDARSILGAWLVQARDRVAEAARPWPASGAGGTSDPSPPRVVTRRAPTAEEWEALRFAWRVAAHVKSNTVVFTRRDVTLAVGAGQMSRVDAVNAAVMKGGDRLRGSVAASDAFFPFRDGLDALAAAGATAVVQPGGSVRDAEVIAAADEHGLAMIFTGRRHFRH